MYSIAVFLLHWNGVQIARRAGFEVQGDIAARGGLLHSLLIHSVVANFILCIFVPFLAFEGVFTDHPFHDSRSAGVKASRVRHCPSALTCNYEHREGVVSCMSVFQTRVGDNTCSGDFSKAIHRHQC